MNNQNSHLELLSKILIEESNSGFQNRTVIGGLDKFLARWSPEISPVIGEIPNYASLSSNQRKIWIHSIQTLFPNKPFNLKNTTKTPNSFKNQIVKPTSITLKSKIIDLPSIGRTTAEKFSKLGINTIIDLLYTVPRRHNDFGNRKPIAELISGEEQTIIGSVWECQKTKLHRNQKRHSTQAIIGDKSGSIRAIWYNNEYVSRSLPVGTTVVLSGKVNLYRNQFVFQSPEFEAFDESVEQIHTNRLVPVYNSTEHLPQRTIRRTIKIALDSCLPMVSESLPIRFLSKNSIPSLRKSIEQIHYPDSMDSFFLARNRLAYEELLRLQLSLIFRKEAWQKIDTGIPMSTQHEAMSIFEQSLPFELTKAQKDVIGQINSDLRKKKPMSRLLQGDVGSGKTVIATYSLIIAALNGYQGVLMAPTEILAEQHYMSISSMLSNLRESKFDEQTISFDQKSFPYKINIGLLTGSMTKKSKTYMHDKISNGSFNIVIGTQALLEEIVEIPHLALIVVDEQHRFGITQRSKLVNKGKRPHMLAMSATPIPRTLALTLYGDLDISSINELPPGRKEIQTIIVNPDTLNSSYEFIREQINLGKQAFVVCPLIDESETIDTNSAIEEFNNLSMKIFPEFNVGLVHGRMNLKEKDSIMANFKANNTQIIVATSVIEVGIDVPNATVMMITGAERFGLSQIHQLRGRVGRGNEQSYCLVTSNSTSEEATARIKIFQENSDGFELAEEDLRIRGPGDLTEGIRQSGIPLLKIAKVSDQEILKSARQDAELLLSEKSFSSKYYKTEIQPFLESIPKLKSQTNFN